MICILPDYITPYENLACEYYFATERELDGDVFMLWRNEPSVIVGKYQNTYEEVNLEYTSAKGIHVSRRMSGGGTVYHDLGGWQFTFITRDAGESIEFDRFMRPITEALCSMGLDVRATGRNDIALFPKGSETGYKISGNTQYKKNGVTVHHGTLLFQADMEKLHDYLKVTDATIESKAVASVSSSVTNISSHLQENQMSIEEFKSALRNQLSRQNDTAYMLSDKDKQAIQKLRDEKYNTWEWNWGKSPKFTLRRDEVTLFVEHGIITECTASFLSKEANAALIGQRYGYQNLTKLLSPYLGDETKHWLTYLF